MATTKATVGQRIEAKFSDGEFYAGKILKITSKAFTVLFDDGDTMDVPVTGTYRLIPHPIVGKGKGKEKAGSKPKPVVPDDFDDSWADGDADDEKLDEFASDFAQLADTMVGPASRSKRKAKGGAGGPLTFDREGCDTVRSSVLILLKSFADEHNLSLDIGSMSYTKNLFTFKVSLAASDSEGNVLSLDVERYKQLANKRYGLSQSWLFKPITTPNGHSGKIMGLLKHSKFPVLVEADGKQIRLAVEYVKLQMNAAKEKIQRGRGGGATGTSEDSPIESNSKKPPAGKKPTTKRKTGGGPISRRRAGK